jgi:hypothetical protein
VNGLDYSPNSVVEEIRRVDGIAGTVFEVYIALATVAAAVVAAVDNNTVQSLAALFGVLFAFISYLVVPDVVFGMGQVDPTDEEALREYLKERQQKVLFAIYFILSAAYVALAFGFFLAIAVGDDDPVFGLIIAGVMLLVWGVVAYFARNDLWPRQLRSNK